MREGFRNDTSHERGGLVPNYGLMPAAVQSDSY
jgi:hypothetical protein